MSILGERRRRLGTEERSPCQLRLFPGTVEVLGEDSVVAEAVGFRRGLTLAIARRDSKFRGHHLPHMTLMVVITMN